MRGITAVSISVTYLFRVAEHHSVRNIPTLLHWRVVSYARLRAGLICYSFAVEDLHLCRSPDALTYIIFRFLRCPEKRLHITQVGSALVE